MTPKQRLPKDVTVFLQGLVADVSSEWFDEGNEANWRDGILANAQAAREILMKYNRRAQL